MEVPTLIADPGAKAALSSDGAIEPQVPLTSSRTSRGFRIGIYLEHLEEAAILYTQRSYLLDDPGISWDRVGEFEGRFEAHIDALVLGGELALEVCRQQAVVGDAGELHAAVRVFCRQNRRELFDEVLKIVDLSDDEVARALADALKHELPAPWKDWCLRTLEAGGPLEGILAEVVGFRRLANDQALARALKRGEPSSLPRLVWAIGRCGDRSVTTELLAGPLRSGDLGVRTTTSIALMRIGEVQLPRFCTQAAETASWPMLPLAVGGGRAAAHALLGQAMSGRATGESILALGMLGDVSAVPWLISALNEEPLAPAAAIALDLITGAGLVETIEVEEEPEDDEQWDPEGVPGVTEQSTSIIERASQDPATWGQWWLQHRDRFDPGLRWRVGQPCSPSVLVDMLRSGRFPRAVRVLVVEELVIRYGAKFPFETDLPVAYQYLALRLLEQWAHSSGTQPGAWYYAGQPGGQG